jgi:Uma2 family endonuclease
MTYAEYRQLDRPGEFADQPTLLLDGEVIQRPLPSPPHNCAVSLTDYVLKPLFGPGHWVRIHMSLPVGDYNDPTPDVAVMAGSPRDYATTAPRTAVMVVEVSDGTWETDTQTKPFLYAAAGVPEYWVIDVNDPRLLVFRDPVADATAPRGFRYATTQTLTAADTVSPTAMPTAVIRVAELLP